MSATPPLNPTHRRLVFIACLLATSTTAIEATIVASSMPSIVAEVGGFKYYAWAFSIYLLTQVVTAPIYGKLADTFGRKPVLVGSLALFMLGSIACGFATSMEMLIAFRFLQGFGAGAVQPVSMTIVGDMYSIEERASIQGYVSAVWGTSSIAGPIVGGIIVQTLGWSWIFWVSIPFGIACIALVSLYLHENISHKQARIDFLGASLLFVALSALILALTAGTTLVFVFWSATGQRDNFNAVNPAQSSTPPEALMYLNPFVAQADVICGTETGFGMFCSIVAGVTSQPVVGFGDVPVKGDGVNVAPDRDVVADVVPAQFGIPRDGFWPRSLAAWVVLSIVLIVISVQLVSPTRRWRIHLRPVAKTAVTWAGDVAAASRTTLPTEGGTRPRDMTQGGPSDADA